MIGHSGITFQRTFSKIITASLLAGLLMNPGLSLSFGEPIGNPLSYINGSSSPAAYAKTLSGDSTSLMNELTMPLAPSIAPTAKAATGVTTNTFTANWEVVSGATGYRIDVATDIGFTNFESGFNDFDVGNNLSFLVNGLTPPGTTYFYQVRAYDGSGSGGNSNIITVVTVPNAPVLNDADTITSSGFMVNWGAVDGADGYRLDVATDSNFLSFVSGYNDVDVGTGTSMAVTDLDSSTIYYFRVRTYNASGTSDNSSNGLALTKLKPPKATSAAGITTNSFSVNWESVASATTYYLDVATNDAFTNFLPDLNDQDVGDYLNFNIYNLDPGTPYYYRVRASNHSGEGDPSNTISVVTHPIAPALSPASDYTDTGFTINWNSVLSATGYILEVATDNTFSNSSLLPDYKDIDVGDVTAFPVTGLDSASTYYYHVRAYNTDGSGAFSNTGNALTLPAKPTASGGSGITTNSFHAYWGDVTGADRYQMDAARDRYFTDILPGYADLDVGSAYSWIVTGLSAGTNYYYRVHAHNASGWGPYSDAPEVLTLPPDPTGLTASGITTNSFTVSWTASTGADSYRLDVATDKAFSNRITNYSGVNVGNVTSVNVTGLGVSAGNIYYFRVWALNSSGNSDFVNNSTLTLPPAPEVIDATGVTSSGFNANWKPATGASGYLLDLSTDGAFTAILANYNAKNVGSVTTTGVTGLSGGTTYYYRVRAANDSGNSASSKVIGVKTSLDLAPAVSAVKANRGSTTGGMLVTITGTGFKSGAVVTFGTAAAAQMVVVNATTLTCLTPNHAAGLVNVSVTNADALSGTLPNAFTFVYPIYIPVINGPAH